MNFHMFVIPYSFEALHEPIYTIECHLEVVRTVWIVFEVETLAHDHDALLLDEGFIEHL